jgi:hypothetical protein
MVNSTDTDFQRLENLVQGMDKKIDNIDTRSIEIEKKIDKQDTCLWAFGGIILAAALGTIVRLLGTNPI